MTEAVSVNRGLLTNFKDGKTGVSSHKFFNSSCDATHFV